MAVKQNIVKFNVAMDDTYRVHVGDTLHDLLEQVFCILFCELSALTDIVQKVAAWAEFHYDQIVFGSLKCLHQLYVASVLN